MNNLAGHFNRSRICISETVSTHFTCSSRSIDSVPINYVEKDKDQISDHNKIYANINKYISTRRGPYSYLLYSHRPFCANRNNQTVSAVGCCANTTYRLLKLRSYIAKRFCEESISKYIYIL